MDLQSVADQEVRDGPLLVRVLEVDAEDGLMSARGDVVEHPFQRRPVERVVPLHEGGVRDVVELEGMRKARADVRLVWDEALQRVVDRGLGVGQRVFGISEHREAPKDRRSQGAGEDGASSHEGGV